MFWIFIHKEKFSYQIHFVSPCFSHTCPTSHFIKQLAVHDSAEQKPKWIALIGSGQIL